MKLPKITPKQQEILKLLYRYRFLNRIQIQTAMQHKDYKTINLWLKDLREKHYVEWIYSTHFLEKTKPAIYYLGINGIRFLKTTGQYPLGELRKRYREAERTDTFRRHCLLVADCCIALEAKLSQQTGYDYLTQADYTDPDDGYYFLAESETISPDLCIIRYDRKKKANSVPVNEDEDAARTNYLLEIFDPSLPHYRMKYRLKQYVTYLSDDEWESGDNDPPPIILLVCPRTTDLIYAKHKTRKLLLGIYNNVEAIPDDLHIRFMTIEQLHTYGITSPLWEEGRARYGV